MWAYVAPGSGVSVNVGRTLVVRLFAEAEAILRYLFPGTASSHIDGLPCNTTATRREGRLGSHVDHSAQVVLAPPSPLPHLFCHIYQGGAWSAQEPNK